MSCDNCMCHNCQDVRVARQQESEGECTCGPEAQVCLCGTEDVMESEGVVIEITVEDHTVLLPPEIENGRYTARLTRIGSKE